MQTDSIELGFLSIFALITFFIFLIIEKFSYKLSKGSLLDNDFDKPQSFHDEAVSRSGGIACQISLFLIIYFYYVIFDQILFEYIFIGTSLFLIGYMDDIKIMISPIIRLLLMVFFILIIINFLSIKIYNLDLILLKNLLKNKIFLNIFILLCFLFIINGANLIDGFNGLLAINLLIINSVLLFINLKSNHVQISFFLTGQIVILISFLLFNFPKAKMFLGDSGSYLLGSTVALNTILTNNLNPQLSSFFFCILLFYLFFEVFFSFLRKLYQNKSPVLPDNKHLHMLNYRILLKHFDKKKSNYLNSIIINFTFCVLVLPSLNFAESSLICKYWFFSLLIIYTLIYIGLYRLTKNQFDI